MTYHEFIIICAVVIHFSVQMPAKSHVDLFPVLNKDMPVFARLFDKSEPSASVPTKR